MASVELNAITEHFRGRVGDVVFKRLYGRLVVSMRPRPTTKPPSELQLAHQQKFRDGA